MLIGMRGDHRVGTQIPSRSGILQQIEEQAERVRTGREQPDGGYGEPLLHDLARPADGHGVFAQRGMGHQPNEREHHDPREAHRPGTGQRTFPPLPRSAMVRRRRVVGVDQEVDVGDDHAPRAVSSASI